MCLWKRNVNKSSCSESKKRIQSMPIIIVYSLRSESTEEEKIDMFYKTVENSKSQSIVTIMDVQNAKVGRAKDSEMVRKYELILRNECRKSRLICEQRMTK